MSGTGDAELAALAHALDTGDLQLPAGARVVLLNARVGAGLPRPGWYLEQDDAVLVARLRAAGLAVAAPDEAVEAVDAAIVLAPRSRDLCRILLARAAALTAGGGAIIAVAGNQAGAGALQGDVATLAGAVRTLAKHRCRVVWSLPGHGHDPAVAARWAAMDAPVLIEAGWWSRPGLFAWNRIDAGSALLAAHLPADLAGAAADLGAGFGFLAVSLLQRCPGIASVDLFEADRRALAPARRNLDALAPGRAAVLHWHDVAAGLPGRYQVVVSNPPFHAGDRADRPDLGQAFIAAAADALAPDGSLWLVANRHLPYEATLAARFAGVDRLADSDGYKVLRAERPR